MAFRVLRLGGMSALPLHHTGIRLVFGTFQGIAVRLLFLLCRQFDNVLLQD
nr:hypothetical protein [uncultured Bacteroides sp.]